MATHVLQDRTPKGPWGERARQVWPLSHTGYDRNLLAQSKGGHHRALLATNLRVTFMFLHHFRFGAEEVASPVN